MPKKSSLKNVSIKQLEHELNKRKQEKIAELNQEKTAIEEKLRSLTGNTVTVASSTAHVKLPTTALKKAHKVKRALHKKVVTKKRILGAQSLKDRVLSIAKDGAERTTNDFISDLTKDGWKSTSAKPYYVVAAALANLEKHKLFRRVAKGKYQIVPQVVGATEAENAINAMLGA